MKALKQQLSKESVAGVLFTLPFTIGFLLFMIVPMGISLYYSFCDYDILSPPVFTGLKNFISMFQDETFFKTLKVTFFFSAQTSVCFDCGHALAGKFQNVRFLQGSLLSSLHYRRFRGSIHLMEEDVCHGRRGE